MSEAARSRTARLLAAAFLSVAAFARAQTAEEVYGWLRAVDEARNAFAEAKIRARATQTENGRVVGSADFDVYVKGRDRALIVFRGGKNAGRKALTVGPKMWLIVPGAEHPVPITANQRLMGGASFGDVAQMRFAEDFRAELRPGTEKVDGQTCRVLDLAAKAPASAYPKVTLWLDAEGERRPRKLLFFLPSGKEAREVTFTKFGNVRGKTVVTEMEVRDLLGPNASAVTRLEYLEIQPAKIDDSVFTPAGAEAL